MRFVTERVVTHCDTSFPNGHWFKSQGFHFQFSSLPVSLGEQLKMALVLGPLHPTWGTQMQFQDPTSTWPSAGHYAHLGSEPAHENLCLLSFSFHWSLCLSNKPFWKNTKMLNLNTLLRTRSEKIYYAWRMCQPGPLVASLGKSEKLSKWFLSRELKTLSYSRKQSFQKPMERTYFFTHAISFYLP